MEKKQSTKEMIWQGEELFNEGRLDEAESHFSELSFLFPSNTEIKNNLGVVKFAQGDVISAKEYFLTALAINDQDKDALSNLKDLYKNFGSWETFPSNLLAATSATTFFEDSFRLDPKDPAVHNDQGIIHLKSGRFDQAEKSMRMAIELDPSYQEAFYNLGNVFLAQERYAEAIDNFIAAIIINHQDEIAVMAARAYQNDDILNKARKKYKRILIVMEEGIGNMVMLTPTLKAIKELYPASRITLFGRAPSIDVIDESEYVDSIITRPGNVHYDIGMLTIWSGNFISNYRSWIHDHCNQILSARLLKDQHEADSHFHLARCLGYTNDRPETFCMSEDRDYPLPKDKPIAALSDTTLNNGAWDRKRWPYYKELAIELIKRGYTVALIGGQYENSHFKPDDWPKEIINLMGKFSLPEITGILKQCHMFIGNDSGPAHIAAAVGIPTCVLFGATLISKNLPIGKKVKALNAGLKCSPCQYTERWTRCTDWQCMKAITIEDVLSYIQEKIILTDSSNSKRLLMVGVLDVESSTNVFMKKGFEKLGWHVDAYNYRTRLNQVGSTEKLTKDFLRFLDGKNWDLIIFCKINQMLPDAVVSARAHGKTWYWFMDNIQVARTINADLYVKNADFASATSQEVYEWFRSINQRSFQILEGYDPDTYYPEALDKQYNVLFVGNATENRIKDLREIKKACNLSIFGQGWPDDLEPGQSIFNADLCKAIGGAKIILNLVHSNIFSDRVILTMAAGGFVLSQYCPDLARHFKRKTHLDWFENTDQAKSLIAHYLKNEEERTLIAQQGTALIRSNFTWESVAHKVIDAAGEDIISKFPRININKNHRVLFVSWHGLGDNVMLTPALRKYRESHPQTYIAVAGLKRFGDTLKQLLSGLPFIDEVIPCLPDAWNDFADYPTGVNAVITEAKKTAAPQGFNEIKILPTNRQDGYRMHKIFRFADEVGVTFNCLEDLQTELAVSPDAERRVENFIRDMNKPILVLHAKAGNQPKILPPESVQQLLAGYQGYTVLEFGRKSSDRSIEIPENDMAFSKALIKRADMVIAIDSVVMHIAGAFRRPLLAIFTMTPLHQAVPLTYRVDTIGIDNPQTALSAWPSFKAEIEKTYPRKNHEGFDQRWYYEGGSACYQGYWWGERGGMGLRIQSRMHQVIRAHPKMFVGCKVIDVGCAAGYYVKTMRELGIEAFGCDPSSWIVHREETMMTSYKPFLNIGYAQKIPFIGKYETLLALDVLEHLSDENYQQFIHEVKRLDIRNLIIKVPTEDHPGAYDDPTHILIKSKSWWVNEFIQMGFELMNELDDAGSPIWVFSKIHPAKSFEYSQTFYEEKYHHWTREETWDSFEKAIQNVIQYRPRYNHIFNLLKQRLPFEGKALFCGVHQGKDCHWFQEVFPKWDISGFDFSREALNWLDLYYPSKANLFWADAARLETVENPLDATFQAIICIDFTEHLPHEKSLIFARETYRVAQDGAVLVAMQGTTSLPEHINILQEQDFIRLFSDAGWRFIEKMPFDHFLFRKNAKSVNNDKGTFLSTTGNGRD